MLAANTAESTIPDSDCSDVGCGTWIRLDARGLAPMVAFDGVADGNGGCGVANFEVGHSQALHFSKLVENLARIVVLAELQVGVDEIVHGVELFADVVLIAGGLCGGEVGGDGVLPEAEAGKDVRGHVQGMRRGRGDARVFACRS